MRAQCTARIARAFSKRMIPRMPQTVAHAMRIVTGPTFAPGRAGFHTARVDDERMGTGAKYLPCITHHPAQLQLLEVHAKLPL